VYAENNKLPGGDPDALKMLIAGEIQFFTLMGGIIGTVVPVAEAQAITVRVQECSGSAQGDRRTARPIIGQEMAAKGMHLLPWPASTTACGRWRRSPGRSLRRRILPA